MTEFQTPVIDLIMSGLAQVPPAKHADWLKQMMTSSAAGVVAVAGRRAALEHTMRVADGIALEPVEEGA